MKTYMPDNKLITYWSDAKKITPYPFMAVFEFDNKRLIYVGTRHNMPDHLSPESFYAINYAFDKFNIDCVVTEFEHTYKSIEDRPGTSLGKPGMNELAYSAYIANIKKIPCVFADTNIADWIQDFEKVSHHKAVILQTMLILNKALSYKKYFNKNDTIKHAFTNVKCDLAELGFDMQLTIQEFKDCVQTDFGMIVSDENISDILATIQNWKEPNINGHLTNKIWAEMGMISRNPYMLDNIFKAVNKYNTVLVTMGSGHYEEQRLVLEKAFGEPKYIHKFPETKRFDIELSMLKNMKLDTFPKTIKTPRLVLQVVEPTKANAEIFLKVIESNRDYLEAWQGHFEYLQNIDDVKKKLEQRYTQMQNSEGMLFGIYKCNNLIGRIRFFDIHDDGCEIGYWLIESANGQGYMSEALSALETELFKFGFKKVTLDIDNGNTHSENLAKRNGYKLAKRLLMNSWAKCVGKCDSLIYIKNKEKL